MKVSELIQQKSTNVLHREIKNLAGVKEAAPTVPQPKTKRIDLKDRCHIKIVQMNKKAIGDSDDVFVPESEEISKKTPTKKNKFTKNTKSYSVREGAGLHEQ